MSRAFLEMVELEDGTFALKRLDEEGEPLVEIHFSSEIDNFLGNHKIAIAKAMLGAGVQAVGAISQTMLEEEESEQRNRVLH